MLDPDPVGSYGTDLCNSLAARDVEVKLLTAKGYLHRDRVRCACVEVAPHSGAGRKSRKLLEELRYLARLFQEAFSFRPDLVHVQWLRLPVEVAAVALLRALRFRIVWTAHNVVPHEDRKLAAAAQSMLYRMADLVVVHANATRDRVAQRFGVPAERIRVIPHGFSTEERGLARGEARRRLALPERATLFLFFGQFRAYKGYEDLIAAFAGAAHAGDGIHLVLAGRAAPDRAEDVRARLDALPPETRARVHSFVRVDEFLSEKEMDALFSACDCVVLPYAEISQSGVLYRAFGYERPVIATRVGGFTEVVEEGRNGLHFTPGDIVALAKLLRSWGGRNEELAAMGRTARAMALRHSWDRVADITREAYRITLEAA
jgi:glycosyltransferase involved in cell wall biosynthesis